MPWITGAIIGGASLLGSIGGDVASSNAQAGANATNLKIAQEQMDFQKQQQQQVEQYDTQMSDTAIQRRAADLEAAGLNPQLAVGNPASSPMVSSAQGAAIPVQSTGQAFGNLGSQVSQAAQAAMGASSAQAQIAQTNAQTKNVQAETATKLAQLPYSGAMAEQQVQNLRSQQNLLETQSTKMQQDWSFDNNTFETREKTLFNNADFQRQMNDLLLKAQEVDLQRAKLGLPQLSNDAAFANTWWGKYIAPFMQSGGSSALGHALPFVPNPNK